MEGWKSSIIAGGVVCEKQILPANMAATKVRYFICIFLFLSLLMNAVGIGLLMLIEAHGGHGLIGLKGSFFSARQ